MVADAEMHGERIPADDLVGHCQEFNFWIRIQLFQLLVYDLDAQFEIGRRWL